MAYMESDQVENSVSAGISAIPAETEAEEPRPISFLYTDRVRLTFSWLNEMYEAFKDRTISHKNFLSARILPVIVDLVLHPEWRKVNPVNHFALIFLVGRLIKVLDPEKDLPVKNIVRLIEEPWSQKILTDICNKSPEQLNVTDVYNFFQRQSKSVSWLRFKFIIENDKKYEIFYGYVYWFIRILNDPDRGLILSKDVPKDKIVFVTDNFLKRLYKLKTNVRSKKAYLEMASGLPVDVLFNFILRTFEKELTAYSKMLHPVVIVLIGRHLSLPPTDDNQKLLETYLDLFWKLCKLNKKPDSFVENIKEFCRLTPTAVYIYSFARFIFKEMDSSFHDIVIDLYTRGIITDANAKDNAREVKKDAQLVREIGLRLSGVFNELAIIFNDQITVKREFVLNSFCVHPTKDNFEKLYSSYLETGIKEYEAFMSGEPCTSWHEKLNEEPKKNDQVNNTNDNAQKAKKDEQLLKEKTNIPVEEEKLKMEVSEHVKDENEKIQSKEGEINEVIKDDSQTEKSKEDNHEELRFCFQCLSHVKPLYNIECCETDVESRYLNPLKKCVTNSIFFDDLSSAVRITRGKTLHWDLKWEDIEREAVRLITTYEDLTNLVSKPLEYLNFDFNQLLDEMEKNHPKKTTKKKQRVYFDDYESADSYEDRNDSDADYTYSGKKISKSLKARASNSRATKNVARRKSISSLENNNSSDFLSDYTSKNFKKSNSKISKQYSYKKSNNFLKGKELRSDEENSYSSSNDSSEKSKTNTGYITLTSDSIDTDYDPYESNQPGTSTETKKKQKKKTKRDKKPQLKVGYNEYLTILDQLRKTSNRGSSSDGSKKLKHFPQEDSAQMVSRRSSNNSGENSNSSSGMEPKKVDMEELSWMSVDKLLNDALNLNKQRTSTGITKQLLSVRKPFRKKEDNSQK